MATEPTPRVTINLSGNQLVLGKNGKWLLSSSDLDQATLEIEGLLTEKEELATSLSQVLQQAEDLRDEVRELNKVKALLLEMVGCLTLSESKNLIFAFY